MNARISLGAVVIVDQNDLVREVIDISAVRSLQEQAPAFGSHAELTVVFEGGGPVIGECDLMFIHGCSCKPKGRKVMGMVSA
jgi:hypothetical protein